MSKEAEILKTGISCHDTHFAKNQANQGGSCISGVSVLQKLTLKLSDYGQSYLFNWISQRIENAFWQSLKAEVNRSIIWKLTILPFFEKMGQDLSYNLYLKSFLFLKIFK